MSHRLRALPLGVHVKRVAKLGHTAELGVIRCWNSFREGHRRPEALPGAPAAIEGDDLAVRHGGGQASFEGKAAKHHSVGDEAD